MTILETLEKDSINIELYSKGIKKAEYYNFRDAGHVEYGHWKRGKMQKFIHLDTTSEQILIRDIKARRQFLSHLGLKLREMERITDFQERDKKLADAISDRAFDELANKKKPLVYRTHDRGNYYEAWSIVTSDYVEVPTKEATAYFEEILKKTGYGNSPLTEEWNDGKAVMREYALYQAPEKPVNVGDIASCNVILRAGYSGDRSVGLIGGYKVLVCQNGLICPSHVTAYTGIHKGISKDEILGKLEHAFNEILAELPQLEVMVKQSKEPLDKEEEEEMLNKILAKYPEHLQEKVREALKKYADTQGTYKISQALSDTATHYQNISRNYRTEMEQEAFKVLTIPRKKKKQKPEEN